MNIKPFIVLLFFSASCSEVDLDKVVNLNGNKILVVGHGGEGFQTGRHPIPTNSESSIAKAIEYRNADGCELDVQLSKDTIPILFHDNILEEATDCQGCLQDQTAEVLTRCRFKQDFAVNAFQEEKIITLEKIFQKYATGIFHPVFFLDIKSENPCISDHETDMNKMAVKINELIIKYNLKDRVFISCGSEYFLQKIQAANPELRLLVDIGTGSFDTGFEIAKRNKLWGIEIRNDHITSVQVKDAHEQNLWVIVYGVKTRGSIMDAVEKSPEVIETDNIPLLQEILSD